MASLIVAAASRAEKVTSDPEIPHPMISTHTEWMVILLIIAAAIFLAALIAGPIIRMNTSGE